MPVPKRKVSRSRRDRRRAMDKYAPNLGIRSCPQCGEPSVQHQVCKACGFYKSKEIIEIPLE